MESRPSVSEDARALTSGIPSRKHQGAGWIASADLVGRDGVLAALEDPGRVCTIVFGEPGIGKTRLLTESRLRAPTRTVAVSCVPINPPIPFEPLSALARSLERAQQLRPGVHATIIGSSEADRLVCLRDALASVAEREALLVQIDDIHVADSGSLEALLYCVTRLKDLPIRWQLAARRSNNSVIDLASTLERSELARVVNLSGLTPADLKVLALRLRPDLEFDDAQALELHRQTGGNPLYAELLIVAPMLSGNSAASDLQRALNQRLEALSTGALSTASWLAINVDPLTKSQLEVVSGRSPAEVARSLTELRNESIIEEVDEEFKFRHELLRESCSLLLDEPRTVEMHATLSRQSANEWKRAFHLYGAHQYRDAARVYMSIGWERLERQAPTEALRAFESAAQTPRTDPALEVEATAGKAGARAQLGEFDDALREMRAFEERAGDLQDAVRVKARTVLAECLWEATDDDALTCPLIEKALGEASGAAPACVPRLLSVLGAIWDRRGDLARARATLERGLSLCESPRDNALHIRLSGWLAVVLARQGRVEESIERLESAAMAAAAANLSDELARCCARLCYVSHMAGDSAGYEHWCRVGLAAEGPKSKAIEALLRSNLASVAIDRGSLREALSLVLAAQDVAASCKAALQVRLWCLQVQLYAMLGDFGTLKAWIADLQGHDFGANGSRAVSHSLGYASELQTDYNGALDHYRRALKDLRLEEITEDYQVSALSGIARMAAALGGLKEAQTSLKSLGVLSKRDWPMAQRHYREAQGFVALARGDRSGPCLLSEVSRASEDPFWRAHLQVIVANATGDRELFLEAIDRFDAMGSTFAADRARALARAHGLRPGRKREFHGVLSSREASVASLIAGGKTNSEIGELLHISSRTVEYHVGNILSKCGLRSRIDIARMLAAGQSLGPPASA